MFSRGSGKLVTSVLVAAIALTKMAAGATTNIQYRSTALGIAVNIFDPPNSNAWVAVNHSISLEATAADIDECRVSTDGGVTWGAWKNYGDDVSSGTTASDYHVIWTGPGNPDIEFPGGRYGRSVLYKAGPPGSSGTASITCEAFDYDRANDSEDTNGDTAGSPDSGNNSDGSGSDTVDINIWEVEATVSQAGSKSLNNDVADRPLYGDPKLGWVFPGTPPGCIGYHGNTEIKGVIKPASAPGFLVGWRSEVMGTVKHIDTSSVPNYVIDLFNPTWTPDGPNPGFADVDPKFPNGTGSDTDEVFMNDNPGARVGASNDSDIVANGWSEINWDDDYRSYAVSFYGVPISNVETWEVKFVLEVVNQKWSPVSHTP